MSIIGSAPWLVAKPAAPSVWDDEFEADGLDPKWTRISGGNVYATTPDSVLDPYASFTVGNHKESINRNRRGWYFRQATAGYGAGSYSIATEGIKQTLTGLPANAFLYMRATRGERRTPVLDGDGEVNLHPFNAASPNDAITINLDSFGSQTGCVFGRHTAAVPNFTLVGETVNYMGRAHVIEFVGLQKIALTWHGWVGTSAGNWIHLGSYAHAVAMDSVLIAFNNQSATAPGNLVGGVDYFRVIAGKGPP